MILRGGNRLQKVKSQKLPLLNTFSYTIYVVSEKLRNPISFKLSCFSLKKSSQNRCPARNGSAVLSRIAWMWWQPALLAAVLVTSRLFSWTAAPPPALASLASSFFFLLTAFSNAQFPNQAEEQGSLGSEEEGAVQFSRTDMPLFAPGPSDTKLPTRNVWLRPSKLGLRETSLLTWCKK